MVGGRAFLVGDRGRAKEGATADDEASRTPSRLGDLLRRDFLTEVLACACGGTRRVIASVEEGPAARKILRHLELPDAPPVLAAARVDQDCFWPTGPPDDEGCDPPYADDVQRSPPDHAA